MPTTRDEVPEGINADAVTAWFRDNVDGVEPPLTFTLIAGGHSNLTFSVTDAAGRKMVLRRPPLGQVLATAHDMGREHKIISALADTAVPVAPTLGYVADDSVNGAPFYVMEFVDGLIIRTQEQAAPLTVDARRRAGQSLAEVLAAIHAVDPASVGLGDLGRTEGYIERQLTRWYGQWNKSKTRELADIDSVHDRLAASVPEQGPAAIVHGDYRLDNCMMTPDGEVAAVLDWELCTLGDPMADVGLLHVYWSDAGDAAGGAGQGGATRAEGFLTRAEVFDHYAKVSGRDLGNLDYYVAFGYWKLACIVEGVYARYAGGAMGSSRDGFEAFARQVEELAAHASAALDRL